MHGPLRGNDKTQLNVNKSSVCDLKAEQRKREKAEKAAAADRNLIDDQLVTRFGQQRNRKRTLGGAKKLRGTCKKGDLTWQTQLSIAFPCSKSIGATAARAHKASTATVRRVKGHCCESFSALNMARVKELRQQGYDIIVPHNIF